ncbi:hypothetical protein L873DRAFT_1796610 [Choiromyces venosus 120613-1]|uniref:DNA-directed DNA polymerase n=1 Tax=Choiromyces venosus 120613-1 TaxID=1336337 RepID=A0A3N4IRF1_9PEZI|nr:hypothetical protein L873DRAFT_1796610 [Choiromyces venosus 120613-1]
MSMCGNPDYEPTEHKEMSEQFPNVAMLCGNPDYSRVEYIHPKSELKNWNFKKGYSALRVKFIFPKSMLYPPLPVTLDKNITIYPLSGETTITGLEFLSAKNILKLLNVDPKTYYIQILHGVYIPFKTKLVENEQEQGKLTKVLDYKPFFNVINELQYNRRQHPKKSAMERIYKDFGNMLYGKVVCGISNKRSFDARSNLMTAMKGFVRATLAELLNKVYLFGGKVTAVTTDGFVCDIEDLENKIIKYNRENNIEDSFIQDYRNIRQILSGKPEALEVKTNVRDEDLNNGQVPIAAMTG